MKAASILVGKLYTLRNGTVVRVAERGGNNARSRLPAGVLSVWEKDGQEPYEVRSRDVVAPVLQFTSQVTLDAAAFAAVRAKHTK